jgi:hypothetical protein
MGGVDRKRHTTAYAAKATLDLGGNHRIDASFFGDPSDSDVAPQSPATMLFTTTSAFSALSYGSDSQTIRYQGIVSPAWLLEGSVGHASVTFKEYPSVDEWQVTDETTKPPTSTGGKGSVEKLSEARAGNTR